MKNMFYTYPHLNSSSIIKIDEENFPSFSPLVETQIGDLSTSYNFFRTVKETLNFFGCCEEKYSFFSFHFFSLRYKKKVSQGMNF